MFFLCLCVKNVQLTRKVSIFMFYSFLTGSTYQYVLQALLLFCSNIWSRAHKGIGTISKLQLPNYRILKYWNPILLFHWHVLNMYLERPHEATFTWWGHQKCLTKHVPLFKHMYFCQPMLIKELQNVTFYQRTLLFNSLSEISKCSFNFVRATAVVVVLRNISWLCGKAFLE